ncbi:hypothetical protein PX860_15950 [Agrobacterium leguminum]|nr:hypothetical protein [Agrobacterium leguminum]WLD98608.1 hypothetical protein PX860_15950 [Agrobacterium leguminum]
MGGEGLRDLKEFGSQEIDFDGHVYEQEEFTHYERSDAGTDEV